MEADATPPGPRQAISAGVRGGTLGAKLGSGNIRTLIEGGPRRQSLRRNSRASGRGASSGAPSLPTPGCSAPRRFKPRVEIFHAQMRRQNNNGRQMEFAISQALEQGGMRARGAGRLDALVGALFRVA